MSTPALPSPSGSRTPPPSRPPLPVGSSPVNRLTKYLVAHKRDEFQAFCYNETIHETEAFRSSQDFLNFLSYDKDIFRPPDTAPALSMDNFITVANVVAASIQTDHFPSEELLVFKSTENRALLGHVMDTECRPNITAAFSSVWQPKGITHWSCAQLVGERASNGKTKHQQLQNAISYLHYLLLARPDLYVAQGLLINTSKITFLLGIGGCNIRKLTVSWDDKALYELLYAFIYLLYDPGDFANKSYIGRKIDWIDGTVRYTVQIRIPSNTPDGSTSTMDCTDFCAISSRNPFTTRTHILSNARFEKQVHGKALTVLKDQLSRAGTRFDEETIRKAIHRKGVVSGVVEAVHHETIRNRWSEASKRDHHQFGLRQLGLPFMSIPTPRKVLEVLFDVLEVLRHLYSECNVLHRDISAGNVLWMEDSSANLQVASAATVTASSRSPAVGQAPAVSPVFIKYLLNESKDCQQTSMLLIDFNRAELLNDKQDSDHSRMDRTGTPIFIARAVEQGQAVPLSALVLVPPVPQSPEIYAAIHQNRIEKFQFAGERILQKPEREQSPWKHELDHDTESVFWLLLYWAMVMQPMQRPTEAIDPGAWANLLGQAITRNELLEGIANRGGAPNLTHSIYKPLRPLIKDLASILVVDRQWLSESDVRHDPSYICEAFQRLILQFILDHRHQKFMDCEAAVEFRSTKQMPPSGSLSSTVSEGLPLAALDGKRSSPSSMDDGKGKRRRVDRDVGQTEGAGDDSRYWSCGLRVEVCSCLNKSYYTPFMNMEGLVEAASWNGQG